MIKHHTCHLCLLVAIIVCLFASMASSAEYQIDRSVENSVSFVSESLLIDFKVVSDKIDGYAYWEGDRFPPENSHLKSSDVYLEVQLNSFDAGNSMYNRHLKERYFETEKYPYASYKAKVTRIELETDSTFLVHTTGIFSLHGKSKELEVIGSVVKLDGALQVKCEFAVKASDYDIEMPGLIMMKVDDDINVSLEFVLKIVE